MIDGKTSDSGLSRKQFAKTRKVFSKAEMLPVSSYLSPQFFELEMQRIFLKEWLCVGRVDRIERPGDYFTIRLLGEPLVVVRTDQGDIQVLSTICRHRAMEVVEGAGNRRSFRCPYHAWTYSLQGELIGAPEMEQTEGFDRKSCRLPGLRVETWEGFIFVNFDPKAKPLALQVTGLTELLRNWKLSDMRTAEHLIYSGGWNWKVYVDNFMECYHHIGLHRDTVEELAPARLTKVRDCGEGLYGIIDVPFVASNVSLSEGGNVANAAGSAARPVIETLSVEERAKAYVMAIYPTFMFFTLPDCAVDLIIYPETADRSALHLDVLVPPKVAKMPNFDEIKRQMVEGIIAINNQDMWAAESVQRGLSSRFAQAGCYCHLEKALWQFDQFVMDRVLRD